MRGLLWFISAVLLLVTTHGDMKYGKQMKYEDLHENFRRIANNAIVHANKNFGGKHIDFYSILSVDRSKQMVHVLLTSTLCEKTASGHRKDCEVSINNRPLISCVACGLEINCLRFKETKKIKENIKKCTGGEISFHPGAAHGMFLKGDNEQEFGCLGCI